MAELRAALHAAKRAHAIADSRTYDGDVVRYMLEQAERTLREALLDSPGAVPVVADQPDVAQGVISRVHPDIYHPPLRSLATPLIAFRRRMRFDSAE